MYKKTAEIGYWLGESYWNKGIATVAVRLVTEYGFSELNFIRIHAGIFEYNIGFMKVLLKTGMQKTACLKKQSIKMETSVINIVFQKQNNTRHFCFSIGGYSRYTCSEEVSTVKRRHIIPSRSLGTASNG